STNQEVLGLCSLYSTRGNLCVLSPARRAVTSSATARAYSPNSLCNTDISATVDFLLSSSSSVLRAITSWFAARKCTSSIENAMRSDQWEWWYKSHGSAGRLWGLQ